MSDRLQSRSAFPGACWGCSQPGLAPAQEAAGGSHRDDHATRRVRTAHSGVDHGGVGRGAGAVGVTQTRDLANSCPTWRRKAPSARTSPCYFIRGIGSTQFNPNANSKVGVYVDDVYLNSPAVHGAQLFDIERIEVARGPQGYLFGQNTTGGLIRAIATQARNRRGVCRGDAELTLGRFGQVGVGGGARLATWARLPPGAAATREQTRRHQPQHAARRGRGRTPGAGPGAAVAAAAVRGISCSPTCTAATTTAIPAVQAGRPGRPETGGPCANPRPRQRLHDYLRLCRHHEFITRASGTFQPGRQGRAFGASVDAGLGLAGSALTAVSAYEENDSLINEDTDASPLDVVHGWLSRRSEAVQPGIAPDLKDTGGVKLDSRPVLLRRALRGHGRTSPSMASGPASYWRPGTTLEGADSCPRMQTHSAAAFGNGRDPLSRRRPGPSVGLRYTRESKDLDYAVSGVHHRHDQRDPSG